MVPAGQESEGALQIDVGQLIAGQAACAKLRQPLQRHALP
jgi:hypothetical protein